MLSVFVLQNRREGIAGHRNNVDEIVRRLKARRHATPRQMKKPPSFPTEFTNRCGTGAFGAMIERLTSGLHDDLAIGKTLQGSVVQLLWLAHINAGKEDRCHKMTIPTRSTVVMLTASSPVNTVRTTDEWDCASTFSLMA